MHYNATLQSIAFYGIRRWLVACFLALNKDRTLLGWLSWALKCGFLFHLGTLLNSSDYYPVYVFPFSNLFLIDHEKTLTRPFQFNTYWLVARNWKYLLLRTMVFIVHLQFYLSLCQVLSVKVQILFVTRSFFPSFLEIKMALR